MRCFILKFVILVKVIGYQLFYFEILLSSPKYELNDVLIMTYQTRSSVQAENGISHGFMPKIPAKKYEARKLPLNQTVNAVEVEDCKRDGISAASVTLSPSPSPSLFLSLSIPIYYLHTHTCACLLVFVCP